MKRIGKLLIVSAMAIGVIGGTPYLANVIKTWQQPTDQSAVGRLEAEQIELVLRRSYLCGTKDEEKQLTTGKSAEQLLSVYADWEIVSVEPDRLVLHKQVNDLSPVCKENGYFGVSPDGMLALFNGVPSENKVIQTFYQINTDRMEASLPKEEIEHLKSGIRVRDLAEYNSILSTYSEFQLHRQEKKSQ
ncbi:BofC C-terminal domain-containing protein [Brevibacillus massiliensis]|jgi:forespore regulator of the sigma-K checkpoint|uniref:BofC C-terminal domain-containing protein n=1 Tax=Brevibacillus massiliensis TaxID=1118054 RepID=UPI0002D44378|nr:BofC C-terminal domain-containing protein [Brevibacillus massiliensis]